MKIALACFAFLMAAICYVTAAVSTVGAVGMHMSRELQEMLDSEGVSRAVLFASLAFYLILGTVALCIGLTLLGKSRRLKAPSNNAGHGQQPTRNCQRHPDSGGRLSRLLLAGI
jgi:hypothetical protein